MLHRVKPLGTHGLSWLAAGLTFCFCPSDDSAEGSPYSGGGSASAGGGGGASGSVGFLPQNGIVNAICQRENP